MSDSRLHAVDNFVTKRHDIPEELRPDRFVLSPGFTLCIIGAGQGIGAHIALAYARARASNLVLAARTASDLEQVAASTREIHPEIDVITVTCDIASATSVKNLADAVKSKFGRLDLLICNAFYPGPVVTKMDEGEPEWVQRAFDVNATGTYYAAHYFVPLLLSSENGAKAFLAIGTLASVIRRGIIANTGYCISKMAQIRLVEFLHEQYSKDGLFALAIHPGAVATKNAVGNTPNDFMPYLIDPVVQSVCGSLQSSKIWNGCRGASSWPTGKWMNSCPSES